MKGIENIERICAHEQSLAQCRGWLSTQFPNVERVATASTSRAGPVATPGPAGWPTS